MAKGKIKRNSKDSVFCDLFREPEYQLLLYLMLHPEDSDVTVEDMHTVTISNIFVNDLYNDLGFIVRGRLVVLDEQIRLFGPERKAVAETIRICRNEDVLAEYL